MKIAKSPVAAVLLLLLATFATVHAQSYYTNFWATDTNSLRFEIPENTLADVQSLQNVILFGTYSNANFSYQWQYNWQAGGNQFLGPGTVRFQPGLFPETNAPFVCLIKLTPVNVTPGNIGAALPPGASAAVHLQSSSNLTDWKTESVISNTSGASYEFYRVKLQ